VCTRRVVTSFAPTYGKLPNKYHTSTSLFSENPSSEGNYRSNLNDLRKILEQSWNEKTMSHVPTNAESAATAATEAIINTLNDPACEKGKIIMIDIALPSLDPSFGSFYDDVGAVEFCCELAKGVNSQRENCSNLRNQGRVAIVVKDENLVSRAKRFVESASDENIDATIEEIDDFAGLSLSTDADDPQKPTSPYRIGSFLGSADIPSGPNMINDICKLVAKNALPETEAQKDDIIIISCPISQPELIGVRWLVSKHGSSKTIIVVNNRLNPLPRELMASETVYSVLPLIARSVGGDDSAKPNPKIVVLRRYPNAWEIHVDDSKSGVGFELVSSVPEDKVGIRGPSMEYISNRVKEYMQQKFGA